MSSQFADLPAITDGSEIQTRQMALPNSPPQPGFSQSPKLSSPDLNPEDEYFANPGMGPNPGVVTNPGLGLNLAHDLNPGPVTEASENSRNLKNTIADPLRTRGQCFVDMVRHPFGKGVDSHAPGVNSRPPGVSLRTAFPHGSFI
jgi:hypothetical protein